MISLDALSNRCWGRENRQALDGCKVLRIVSGQRNTQLHGRRRNPGIGERDRSALPLARAFNSCPQSGGLIVRHQKRKRARNRCIKSRRLGPQFFTSMPYSISASVINETANGQPARSG
jgi:hypothetical protein